ncbi:hypothetical protein [Glutamicibacter protophormiae]|uniref:hypothetical protein n=1 Tax=Glutamicibacter protophormiae TaxID=37930 RepID=UPI003BAEE62A
MILSGVIAICLYSIFGAVLMNDWAVTAASELPLAATINEMQKAEQNYSRNGGILFAALGMLLALGWGFLTLRLGFPDLVAAFRYRHVGRVGCVGRNHCHGHTSIFRPLFWKHELHWRHLLRLER